MRRPLLIGTASILILLFSACNANPYSQEDLVGDWQAVLMTTEQDTFGFDLSAVKFNFSPEGRYTFNGNLKNHEAGSYYILGKMLYTTDTLLPRPEEKAVQINLLSSDSLRLLMKSETKFSELFLVRR